MTWESVSNKPSTLCRLFAPLVPSETLLNTPLSSYALVKSDSEAPSDEL